MKIIKSKNTIIKKDILKNLVKKSITKGTTPTTIGFEFYDDEDIKFYKVENLKNGTIIKNKKYINKKCHEKMKRSQLELNDLLFSIAGTIGDTAIVKKENIPSNINQAIAIIRLKPEYNVNYVRYYLNYIIKKIKREIRGGVIPNFNLELLSNINLIFFNESEKIASVLSKQERQIEIIETLIEKLEKRNQYYAEKLLSGEKRIRKNDQGEIEFYDNTEWQDVFLNGINKKIPIDSFLITMREKYPDICKKGKSGMKNYLEIGDIDLKTKSYNIDNKDKLSVKNCKVVPKGTLLISTVRPTRGCAAITKSEIPVSSAFARYFINEDSYPMHIINTNNFISYCNKNIEGGTYPTIKAKKIDDYQIIIHKNNDLITEKLKKFNDEIIHIKKIKIKEEKRFQWMLDNLLSGEYQVVD